MIATDPLSLLFMGSFLIGLFFLLITLLLGNMGHSHGELSDITPRLYTCLLRLTMLDYPILPMQRRIRRPAVLLIRSVQQTLLFHS